MKKIITLSLFTFFVLLTGCSKESHKEENIKSDIRQEEEPLSELITDIKMKPCLNTIMGLQFDYPESWGECGLQLENEIFFQKNIKEFRIGLVFRVEKLNYWNSSSKNKSIIPHDNFEIWKLEGDGCGYAGPCYVIKGETNSWYRLWPATVNSHKTPGRIEQDSDFLETEINAIITSVKFSGSEVMNSQSSQGESSGKSSYSLKRCPEKTLGLVFSYPENWETCKIVETNLPDNYGKIYFSRLLNGYQIELIAMIREVDKEYARTGRSGYFEELFKKQDHVEVFAAVCGGAFSCHGLVIDDEKFYELTWEINGTQPMPEFLTGIWNPDHDFTQEDILNIIKSVELVEE